MKQLKLNGQAGQLSHGDYFWTFQALGSEVGRKRVATRMGSSWPANLGGGAVAMVVGMMERVNG